MALADILDRQMDPMFFPVPLAAFAAALNITEIGEAAPTSRVSRSAASGCGTRARRSVTGWLRGAAAASCIPHRQRAGPRWNYPVRRDWRTQLVEFLGGVDTLMHDAMYSE